MRLGEPDIQLAGFSLWVIGRQFPESNDYWDGNWLNVRALVQSYSAQVQVEGSIIRLPELFGFVEELKKVDQTIVGKAKLRCIEPNLSIELVGDRLGHLEMTIQITPDHLNQQHKFIFEVDQTYLKKTLVECEKLLSRYPIKDAAAI